jgi:hypothetical protein
MTFKWPKLETNISSFFPNATLIVPLRPVRPAFTGVDDPAGISQTELLLSLPIQILSLPSTPTPSA